MDVRKLGEFEVEGGKLYRGADFLGFLKKNVRRTSYFEGETNGDLRFTHYTKSGCEFFSLINEGLTDIHGKLITDISAGAQRFDPFTGKTEPMTAEMDEHGFAYPVRVPPHSAVVIGFDPDALPTIGTNPEWTTVEIIALDEGRMTFPYTPAENRRAVLAFTGMHDAGDVTVNGKPAGRILFRPYELDITDFVHEGENEIAVEITPSMANRYGKPVPVGFEGCTVRILESK